MRCPLCEVSMKEIERRNVTVDVCPECRGVWLDRGELERLADSETQYYGERDRSTERPSDRPSDDRHRENDRRDGEQDRGRSRDSYEKDRYSQRKPKSFLSEIIGSLGEMGGD